MTLNFTPVSEEGSAQSEMKLFSLKIFNRRVTDGGGCDFHPLDAAPRMTRATFLLCVSRLNQRVCSQFRPVMVHLLSRSFSSQPVTFKRVSPLKQVRPSWGDQGGYFWRLWSESGPDDGTSPLKMLQKLHWNIWRRSLGTWYDFTRERWVTSDVDISLAI